MISAYRIINSAAQYCGVSDSLKTAIDGDLARNMLGRLNALCARLNADDSFIPSSLITDHTVNGSVFSVGNGGDIDRAKPLKMLAVVLESSGIRSELRKVPAYQIVSLQANEPTHYSYQPSFQGSPEFGELRLNAPVTDNGQLTLVTAEALPILADLNAELPLDEFYFDYLVKSLAADTAKGLQMENQIVMVADANSAYRNIAVVSIDSSIPEMSTGLYGMVTGRRCR